MENFQSLGLPQPLLQSLERMKFTTPTPIQAQAIPLALVGRDVLGTAQTGTGKTGAFGIPLIAKLLGSSRGSALVMTPTRELAVQVLDALQQMLGKYSTISTALLIGGEPMPKQFQQLRNRPRLLVGTPGRINDHLERGTLMLHDTQFLVLDEMDRMLDMGFEIQIERIVKFMPKQRQTLLFSATLPNDIVKMSQKYLNDPARVSVGSTSKPIERITQEVIRTSEVEKYNVLIDQLNKRTGSIIVFVKTKWGAEKLAIKLSRQGHSADALHGDLRQSKRDRVIAAFRDKQHRILIATDIAARGLDIPHIEHVINHDLPQVAEDYIHRIGRTARAGAEGAAICLITPADELKWRAIQRLLNPGAIIDNPGKPQGAGKSGSGNGGANNRPRSYGPKKSGPRNDAPRSNGPRSDGQRSDTKRSDGQRSEGRNDGQRNGNANAGDGNKNGNGGKPFRARRTFGNKPQPRAA